MKKNALLNRCKFALKTLAGRYPAGRNAIIYPDDVIITSYPKSGNTWVRFLVGNLVSPIPPSFSNIEKIVPDVYANDQAQLLSLTRPRILKSHECFFPAYKNVIYLVRNPLDVAVSYFFFLKKTGKIDETAAIDSDYVDNFIEGNFDQYGSWGQNVKSWLDSDLATDNSRFLLIRYEDLLTEPENQLARIAEFLELKKTAHELSRAVDQSNFKKMKESEKATGHNWKPLRHTRRDISFVRSGKSGEGEKHLPPNMVEKIRTAWNDLMGRFGYL